MSARTEALRKLKAARAVAAAAVKASVIAGERYVALRNQAISASNDAMKAESEYLKTRTTDDH
jgi:hypothetical protein